MTPEAFIALGAGLALVKVKTVAGAMRLAVDGKTFATVGWPETDWAVVKLTPSDQRVLISTSPGIIPETGRRGRNGLTLIRLAAVGEAAARGVMMAAWRRALAPEASLAKAG